MQAMRSAFLAQQKSAPSAPDAAPDAPADDAEGGDSLQPYKLNGDEIKQLLTSGTVQCTLSDGETVTLDVDENDPAVQAAASAIGEESGENPDEEASEPQDQSGDDHGSY